MSTTAEATMHVPSYAAWLEQTDQSPAYVYQVKLLKLLQWQRPGKRWVLKSPHHLEFMAEIEANYDQVHFIWTHREVHTCMASFLSMLAYGWSIFSNEVLLEELTRHWLRKMGYMLEKGLAFRQRPNRKASITDVLYETFLEDPIATIASIYQNTGAGPLGNEQEAAFRKVNQQNRKGKYGRHQYDLQDFNLTSTDIDSYTRTYQQLLQELKL